MAWPELVRIWKEYINAIAMGLVTAGREEPASPGMQRLKARAPFLFPWSYYYYSPGDLHPVQDPSLATAEVAPQMHARHRCLCNLPTRCMVDSTWPSCC